MIFKERKKEKNFKKKTFISTKKKESVYGCPFVFVTIM